MGEHATNNSGGLWKGILAGSVVGAVAALLLAPRTGRDTRQKLGEDVRKWKQRSVDLASSAQEKASLLASTAKETGLERLNQTKEAVGSAIESIKESAGDLRESAVSAFGTLKQETEETAKELKQDLVSDAKKLANSDNSSLAQNEKEMIKLGKEMDHMKTDSELEKEGLIPDPIQK